VSGRIDIAFTPAEGAVIRMLGVVERRGFELRGIAMSDGRLALDVAARDPSRRLEIVAGQLRRLVEVEAVSCSPSDQGSHQ